MSDQLSRKDFLRTTTLAFAAIPFGNVSASKYLSASKTDDREEKLSLSIFSKHLQWLNYTDMASLAVLLGYDGIDLTVRAGGHVLPQKVANDLPKAADIFRKAGLDIYTITTDIKTVREPHTEQILKTAASLGIKNYRMGWYGYSGKDIPADLGKFKKDLKDLATINEHYQIHGDYENHTGRFGGPIWDLWFCLKDLNPKWIGCQFDIRHAVVDGAEAWPINLELISSYLGSITIKDFVWKKKADKWELENVPLGQGMIDFNKYFEKLKQYNFQKPISHHFEYSLGGAESGSTKLTLPKEKVIEYIRNDLQTLRTWIKQGL